jgi:RHS repeat-associated protein
MRKILNKLLLLLVVLSNCLVIFGQEKTITLSSDLSSAQYNLEKVARDYIKFEPGFKYTANDHSFTGKIDKKLVCEADFISNPISGNERQLETSNQVGSIPGSYSVSPSGAASYSIPISLPSGVNGVSPSLGISYNSKAGNGILGWGWNLGGISMISRGAKTLLQDGEIGSITFTDEDRYYFNGKRLVQTGGSDYHTEGAVYKTEMDNLSRIVKTTNGFKVYTPNGRIIDYGEDLNSMKLTSNDTIYWYISKIEDYYGNTVIYNYKETNAQKVIDNISYSGNTIEFYYNDRSLVDNVTGYINGEEIKSNHLLSRIEVKTNGIKVNEFQFNYINEKYSLLNEVELIAQNGAKVNSTIIDWNFGSVNSVKNDIDLNLEDVQYYGDFNGDGRTDILSMVHKETYSAADNCKLEISDEATGGYNYKTLSLVNGFKELKIGDFNNDGVDEIYMGKSEVKYEKINFIPVYTSMVTYLCYKYVNGNITASPSNDIIYNNPGSFYNLINPYLLNADFNGDGQMDYILFNKELNTDESFNLSMLSSSFSYTGKTLNSFNSMTNLLGLTILNYNGNRKPDIMFSISASQSEVYEFDSNSRSFVNISGQISGNYTQKYGSGDFNGDGLTDFIRSFNSSRPQIEYGTGNGFIDKLGPYEIFQSDNIAFPYEFVQATDLNNDGKSDLLRYYLDVDREVVIRNLREWTIFTPHLHVLAYFSTGDNFVEKDLSDLFTDFEFTPVEKLGKPEDIQGSDNEINWTFIGYINYVDFNNYPKVNFNDFNLDGNGDVLIKRPQDDVFVSLSVVNGTKEQLVKRITNGMNQGVEFEYATLYNTGVYNRTDLGTYPKLRAKAPIYVVSKTKNLDNGNEYDYTTYKYKNATIHNYFGFLGFEEFEATNNLRNVTVKSTYNFIGDLYMQSLVSSSKTVSGQLVGSSTSSSELLTHNITNGKYFTMRNLSSQSTNHLTATTVNKTYSNFNAVNYQPQTITESYGSDMTITKNIVYDPVVNSEVNLPLRVDLATTISSHADASGSFSDTTDLTYDDPSKPFQLSRKSTDKQLIENYTYETFGGLKKVSIIGGDETRSKEYVYTSDSLHIAKQTTNDSFPTEFFYNSIGQLIETRDHNLNSTFYEYNDFGQVSKVIDATGIYTTSKRFFSTSGPESTAFIAESFTLGSGTAYEYYNSKGQLIQKKIPGVLNENYLVDYEYYDDGKLKREYFAYKEGTSASDNNYYSYDAYGRVTNVTSPLGTVETNYNGIGSKTVQTISPEGQKIQTFDNAGLVKSIQDAGGTINYKYNNRGLTSEITYPNYSIVYDYDEAGNVTSLNEPNLGLTESTYNAFGEQEWYKDAKDNEYTMIYDNFGRLTNKVCVVNNKEVETVKWSYNSNSGLLESVSNGNSTTVYTYDAKKIFLLSQTKTINSQDFTTSFTYDNLGNVATIEYPGHFKIENLYDNNGNRIEIKKAGTSESIWKLDATNAKGMVTKYIYGNGVTTMLGYNAKNLPSAISAVNASAQNVHNWSYGFDNNNNLQFRKNENRNVQEDFTYDTQNRLTSYWDGSIEYQQNGSIQRKTDLGNYNYTADQPHAVSSITDVNANYQMVSDTIKYNHFNKVSEIIDKDSSYKLLIEYGTDLQRNLMQTIVDGSATETKYYVGPYEKIVNEQNQTKELTYISASTGLVAVHVKNFDNTDSLYYIHSDYLGSIMALTNESGKIAKKYFYDAWGQRKDPTNWSQTDTRTDFIIDRGYTKHEHWEHFNLINMNGRVYDPALARFLSPDPTYQSLSNSQALNKYSYVINNPFKYTDPSGYNMVSDMYHDDPTGGGSVNQFYWSFVNGVMGDHYNAGFGNHGGNQMFAGANARMGAVSGMYAASQGLGGVKSYLGSSTYGGSYTVGGSLSLYSNHAQALNAGIAYNNYHGSWGNTASIGGASSAVNATTRFSSILSGQIKPTLSANIITTMGTLAQSNGYFPGMPPPELFSPVRLNENVYQNVLKGFKYLWHYQHSTLPDYEMDRWKNKTLKVSDIFNFSTADGWTKGGFMGGSDVIWGNIGGVEVMLQNTTFKGELQLDPVHFDMLRIFQAEPYVSQRRIGYMKYYKRHNNYYNNALKYIYSPW